MSKSITLVCTKPDTQAQIKSLRAAGLTVIKDSGGMYRADWKSPDGTETVRLFTAMPGRGGYLVRRVANLFG